MPGIRSRLGLLTVALCLFCCMLVGLLAYGRRIFDPGQVTFQFIVSGLIGGAFVVAVRASRAMYVAAVGIFAFVLITATSGPLSPNMLLRNAIWASALLIAVLVALRIEDRLRRLSIGKFVLWAAVFGIVYLFALQVLGLIRHVAVNPGVAIENLKLGALIGAGIGFGHEIAEKARWRAGWRV